MSHNLNDLTEQARDGSRACRRACLHAVGEVGESVQQVHDVVKGSSGSMSDQCGESWWPDLKLPPKS